VLDSLELNKIANELLGGRFMGWQDNEGSPWGGQKPPDFKEAVERIKKSIPFKLPFGGKHGLIPLVVVVLLILWLASGIYFVAPDEVGVVKEIRQGGAHHYTWSSLPYSRPGRNGYEAEGDAGAEN